MDNCTITVQSTVINTCDEWTKLYDNLIDLDTLLEKIKEAQEKRGKLTGNTPADIFLKCSVPILAFIAQYIKDKKQRDVIEDLYIKALEKQADINKAFADYARKSYELSQKLYDMSTKNTNNNTYIIQVLDKWIEKNSNNKYLSERVKEAKELREKIKGAKISIWGLFRKS